MCDDFLQSTKENADLNQYWYSRKTIEAIIAELEHQCPSGSVAFLSTPSIFFSLSEDSVLRSKSKLFDVDKQWEQHSCYSYFDFNAPIETNVPRELYQAFDGVVIDPPFITEQVWAKYAATARLLLRAGGKIIGSSIAENASMLHNLLQLEAVRFRPAIPNLVYQYSLFVNFEPRWLCVSNEEVDD